MAFVTDLIRARQAGAQAARDGARRSTCPYSPRPDAPPRERVLFVAWIRGYGTVVPTPVDYSG